MVEKRVRVLLVDDHELVSQGVRRMLELEEDMEVVGEASNGEEALVQAAALSPDVILMDIQMPGSNGLEATRKLKERGLPGEILIVSMYKEYLAQAIESGAAGYLVKDVKREELVNAIRRVREGELVLAQGMLSSPTLVEAVLRRFQDVVRKKADDSQRLPANAGTPASEAASSHQDVARSTAEGRQLQPTRALAPETPPVGTYPRELVKRLEPEGPTASTAQWLGSTSGTGEGHEAASPQGLLGDAAEEEGVPDAPPGRQQSDTPNNPLLDLVEEQRVQMQKQFVELLQSLTREHRLIYELEQMHSSKSRGGDSLESLPPELRKPAASVEEFAATLRRLIKEGRIPREEQG